MQLAQYVAVKTVPPTLPPHYGWGLFIVTMNFVVFVVLRLFFLGDTSDSEHRAEKAARSMMVPLLLQALAVVFIFTNAQVCRTRL
jgi:hypothetical protein